MPTTRIPPKAQLGVGAFFLFAIISTLMIAGGDDPEPPRERIAATTASGSCTSPSFPNPIPNESGREAISSVTLVDDSTYILRWSPTRDFSRPLVTSGISWPDSGFVEIVVIPISGHFDVDGYWDARSGNHLRKPIGYLRRSARNPCPGEKNAYTLVEGFGSWPNSSGIVEDINDPDKKICHFRAFKPCRMVAKASSSVNYRIFFNTLFRSRLHVNDSVPTFQISIRRVR